MMTLEYLQKHFDNAGLRYAALDAGSGDTILVSERGGRIFGPFGNGIFWFSGVFESPERFRKFLDSKDWNMGGDRIWIAPEIQFNISDRNRFWETLKTPEAVDPGRYRLSVFADRLVLEQRLDLEAHVIASGALSLKLKRTIRRAENPLRELPEFQALMNGVRFSGYEHLVELSREGGNRDGAINAECWNLLQVAPPGRVYIPMFRAASGVNYYEPVLPFEKVEKRWVELCVTGKNRYKTGYRSTSITGRMAFTTQRGGTCFLLVRNFPNNPSAAYGEEPPLMPGEKGFSVHVYNDDGKSGGFAELECNLQAIGIPAGYERAADRVSTWLFSGPEESLCTISSLLTGIEQPVFT
ncbi:MAG: hypothetical protein LBD48_12275 [Treponema sp.]|jgi:hypothetical protein|nr:hypothetical protein [Treponema sp.]